MVGVRLRSAGKKRALARLAVFLTVLGSGCATVKENVLTANLWQKDPWTTIQEQQAHGNKYIHSTFTRTTLTPLAVVGDVTIIGVAAWWLGVRRLPDDDELVHRWVWQITTTWANNSYRHGHERRRPRAGIDHREWRPCTW